MKKANERSRRKKNSQTFLPFLPAWVYLIDRESKVSAVRAWPWLEQAAADQYLKNLTRHPER